MAISVIQDQFDSMPYRILDILAAKGVRHRSGSMAVCVSEYTLEFVKKKGKKEMIASNYEYSKCNERMGLYERKSAVLIDLNGYVLVEYKYGGVLTVIA
ncbi:hypothetical protein TNCV_3751191 [Trichonephila clavipes]|uniref:Uncharacterized protein n=1 Tax=Trichonephila clavipes TaxID=2585209 RepID=A0A8X6R1X4_TRICX|nr:hypothetical protein TNCV_3751191 [Trichonephila clavipes]